MATTYKSVYESAVFQFKNRNFAIADEAVNEALLKRYLNAAVSDFGCCRVSLAERTDDGFVNDLDADIIEILALGVAYKWVSAQTLDSDLFSIGISTRGYTETSPANVLAQMRALRADLGEEFRQRISEYSLRTGGLSNLTVETARGGTAT